MLSKNFLAVHHLDIDCCTGFLYAFQWHYCGPSALCRNRAFSGGSAVWAGWYATYSPASWSDKEWASLILATIKRRLFGFDHRVGHCGGLPMTEAFMHASCLRCVGLPQWELESQRRDPNPMVLHHKLL